MEFSTHNFLKKIRLVAYAIFHGNRLLEKSVDPAEASFRRLYLLSLFSALSLEYLRLSDLGTTTGTLGPLQLPFKGIGSAANDSVLVEALKAHVSDVIASRYLIGTEDELKDLVFKNLFRVFFKNTDMDNSSEFPLAITASPKARMYRVDGSYPLPPTALPMNHLKQPVQRLPGLLIEFQLSNLVTDRPHKDMTKMFVALSKVLLARIKLVMAGSSTDDLRKLKVFGILVGGTWIDFVVAQALISGSGENGHIEIGVVCQSSLKYGRFPLLRTNDFKFDEAGAGDLYSDQIGDTPVLQFNEPEATTTQPPLPEPPTPDEERELIPKLIQNEAAYDDLIAGQMPKTSIEPLEIPPDAVPEVITFRALERFILSFLAHEDQFLSLVRAAKPPYSGGPKEFVFDSRLGEDVPRSSFSSGGSPSKYDYSTCKETPKKRPRPSSESSEVEMIPISNTDLRWKRPYRSLDKHGREVVTIKKHFNSWEIQIYQLDAIKSCPFIPKLLDYHSSSDDETITITLEALSFTLWSIDSHFELNAIDDIFLTWMASSLLLGVMVAVETLHVSGFVHSDLSSGNVCFSREEGIWCLIDFNQSMPIEKSLITPRTFGTWPFVSERAKQRRILEPVDDYVALAKVVSTGFPSDWYYELRLDAELNALLKEMAGAEVIDSNWRDRATRIHEKACANAGKSDDRTLALVNRK